MFNTEIFDGTDWNLGSTHTQEIDRDAQFDRFIANGVAPENIRKSQDEN